MKIKYSGYQPTKTDDNIDYDNMTPPRGGSDVYHAPKMPSNPPMPKCKPPVLMPRHYYKEVFVIIQGETRRYDNADICLFDNVLTISEKNGAISKFNFNNIIGVSCYD